MIITKLIGGLGNQMFQYAAGMSIAKRSGMELRLDVSSLRKYTRHQGYELADIFSGEFKIASRIDLFRVLRLQAREATNSSVSINDLAKASSRGRWLKQPTHNYWPAIEEINHSCYLSGYWQSYKYFTNVEEELRSDFIFRRQLDQENASLASRIVQQESVCLHVRRGDYVANMAANEFHGLCGWDYYEKAIELILEARPHSKFFAFSDEPEVLKRHFWKTAKPEIVDINFGANSYMDMRLMALCKHHIIANSTFSWWAAWLAKSTGQMVIAPKDWFAASEVEMVDIYCPAWIKI